MATDLELIPQFHAVAVNATEMQQSRETIKAWLEAKVASLRNSVEEVYAALDAATRNNWRTAPLEGLFRREKQNHQYYSKLLAAVEAGYTIVPNMPVDVFAIRVKRAKPTVPEATDWSAYHSPNPRLREEEEQRLEPGAGRYVSPQQTRIVDRKDLPGPETGTIRHVTTVKPVDFADIGFPLAVAHPEIMKATERAISYKIFDRIGMVTDERGGAKGDPIVLGQVTYRRGYQRKTVSFLIGWYLDVRTL